MATSNQLVPVEDEQKVIAPANMLDVIARAASDPRVDPAKLSALLDLQERIDARAAEQEFTRDYALAAQKMPRVLKDGVIDMGQKGKILFAKYESLDKAIRPIEVEYGFSRIFTTNPTPNGIEMTLTLAHRGGHSVKSTRFMPPDTGAGRNAMQAIGSASSYAKRYLTLDAWNIVTVGADNDGSTAECLTDQELSNVQSMIDACELSASQVQKFLEFAQADSVDSIQRFRYAEVIEALRKKLELKRRNG